MDDLSVAEARSKKQEVEQKICYLLDEYYKETGFLVDSINVSVLEHWVTDSTAPPGKRRDTVFIQVKCGVKF